MKMDFDEYHRIDDFELNFLSPPEDETRMGTFWLSTFA
jgi:hypothetical protein